MHYSPERITEALTRAHQHWQARPQAQGGGMPVLPAFTIAVSREAGTHAAAIAREVGDRLGWPVYDRELLQRIADNMGVRRTLLESVDERHVSWLNECLEGFATVAAVSQSAYVRHLVETLLSLSTHGQCVIVGRGATNVLPLATTLRVRVVAPLDHRIEAVRREHGISPKEAARKVETTDRERSRFVKDHFLIDTAASHNYDLILNVARFARAECADLIIAALDRLRAQRMPGAVSAPSGDCPKTHYPGEVTAEKEFSKAK
jgi:cytidylate kinase